jgi:WD40 repeat protein
MQVCITPDGRRAASLSEDQVVRVYDMETSRVLLELRRHDHPPLTCICLTLDGSRLLGGNQDSDTVWVRDLNGTQPVRAPSPGERNQCLGRVVALSCSRDGRRVLVATFIPVGTRPSAHSLLDCV